jgi:Thioredoxin-like domain
MGTADALMLKRRCRSLAQTPVIALNIFNYVAVADLASSEGLALAAALGEMLADEFPVRVGILPALPSGAIYGHIRPR